MKMKFGFLFVAWLAIAGYALATAKTARDLEDPSQVTRQGVGGVGRSASWTEDVGTTGEDLFASAQLPTEITAAVAQSIRYVLVTHNDATDSSIPICVRFGPTTDSPALTCLASTAANGQPLTQFGGSASYTIRAPIGETTVANAHVPVWAVAQSGSVLTTVTVFW
jgi:hypothetical protein